MIWKKFFIYAPKVFATGEDLLKVADTLRSARKLRKLIFDQVIRPRLSELLKDIATLPDLQKLLEFGS